MSTSLNLNPSQAKFAVFASALAGFSIPVSTALENISVTLLILFFAVTPALWKEMPRVLNQPFIMACLVFYAVLLFGSTYSSVGYSGATRMLLKMREYLLAPMIFSVFMFLPARRAMLAGFAAGVLLSVAISMMLAAGGADSISAISVFHQWIGRDWLQATPGDWGVFRSHTFHNFFVMMLLVGLLALNMNRELQGRWLLMSRLMIVLCLVDIVFLVQGRTIQLILLAALGLLLILWKKRAGALLALAVIVAIPPVLYFGSSNIRTNISKIESDVQAYRQGQIETSVGYRLDFHKNSLQLIREKPLLGHGTGSFTSEYRRLTGYTEGNLAADNPHNDYFWLGVELGILGIAALLGVIVATIIQAKRRALPERWTAIVLAASMAAITLGNSFFTDNVSRTAFILLACALLSGDSFKSAAAEESSRPT